MPPDWVPGYGIEYGPWSLILKPAQSQTIWFGGAAVGDITVNDFVSESLYGVDNLGAQKQLVAGGKDPDLSPDGGRLVIEKLPGYTYICNRDGSGLVPLSPTVAGGWSEAKWFPDGSGVIVSHDLGGFQEVYKIDYPSGVRHQITSAPELTAKFRPFVASDGRTVIITTGAGYSSASIRRFTLPAVLGSPMITAADMTTLIPYSAPVAVYDAELNPDMTKLCYDTADAGFNSPYSWSVWVADADGSHPQKISLGNVPRWDKVTGRLWFWWWSGPVVKWWGGGDPGPLPYAQSLYSTLPDGQDLRQEFYCNAAESFYVETLVP